ncbi:XdhC family protein [Novosphingobium sp. KACC 22771]|uniref:XdhC family protein n=1 Tax=Novosphingobium sp. KACC 22771 TaxID=3025670 RepID=UPI002365ABFD|nr:XdhC family protein [Novosphingobium sp. KACC 22771]WDF72016.1 XdhC family protein [Novosphingobium sp. KACC 22771]
MTLPMDDDHAALAAAAAHGGALCTVVGIDGSWSRRWGAQLAVRGDGAMVGSLADGCLEAALMREAMAGGAPRVLRYGAGSPFIDIRLPCGSGVEVMVDPAPDADALNGAVAALARREVAHLPLGAGFTRRYLPRLRLLVLGSGPEAAALAAMGRAQGVEVLLAAPHGQNGDATLSLGQSPALPAGWKPDPWTAVAVLFHDHEWERTLIPWAMATDAFYVGAQGGAKTRANRLELLASIGFDDAALARLHSPIGLIPATRTPSVLALSVLAEVVGAYEGLLG